MKHVLVLAAVFAAATASAQSVVPDRFDQTDLDAWIAALTPPPSELTWLDVDWVPSFGEGVRRARAERRPLLFWAMNGHPLGCT